MAYAKVVGTTGWKTLEKVLKMRDDLELLSHTMDDEIRFTIAGAGCYCPLEAAFGLDGHESEIGKILGLSKAQVSTIIEAADTTMTKIKNSLVRDTRKALEKVAETYR